MPPADFPAGFNTEGNVLTLSRENELGTISVSNIFFAQIIADSFNQESCANKVWPGNEKRTADRQ